MRRIPQALKMYVRMHCRGADGSIRNGDGNTPLEMAQKAECAELVELLTRQSRLRRLLSPPPGGSSRRMNPGARSKLVVLNAGILST